MSSSDKAVMAKLRSDRAKGRNGIVGLKIVVEKLQKSLSLGKKSASDYDDVEEVTESAYVPADVKEGHFAVIAVDGHEPKRFVVPLNFLRHPPFLRLLEEAAEEYGFDHEGILTIPCRPSKLERILEEQWQKEESPTPTINGVDWGSSKTMVIKSC